MIDLEYTERDKTAQNYQARLVPLVTTRTCGYCGHGTATHESREDDGRTFPICQGCMGIVPDPPEPPDVPRLPPGITNAQRLRLLRQRAIEVGMCSQCRARPARARLRTCHHCGMPRS